MEADLGYNDKDMDAITYHQDGYGILNEDIMMLQKQVTYDYTKTNPFFYSRESKLYDDSVIQVNEKSYLLIDKPPGSGTLEKEQRASLQTDGSDKKKKPRIVKLHSMKGVLDLAAIGARSASGVQR